MASRRMSGRALSERIGMPQSVFSRRMTGDLPFTVDHLAAISAALDCPLAALVVGVPVEPAVGVV